MFAARAGLRCSGSYGGILGRKRRRAKPRQEFRCWVPFVWQALVAVIAGLVVMLAGIALCTIGYYADNRTVAPTTDLFTDYAPDPPEDYLSDQTHNDNDTMAGNVTKSYLHNLTYVGPMLMGCGCFSTVIACVVVCETRDKRLKAVALRELTDPKPPKTDVCEKIVRYVIAKYKDRKHRRQSTGTSAITCRLIDGDPEGARPGHLSRDTSIAAALKTIPTALFSVDCDRRQLTSLAPINISGDTKCRKIVSVMSAPCICIESADNCCEDSAEQAPFSQYHQVERFPSRHHRQPCMYHDKLFWSFDVASGREHVAREEPAQKNTEPSSGKVGVSPVNWQAISTCDAGTGCKRGLGNNPGVTGDRSPSKRCVITHIAIIPPDDRQMVPAKKTAMVIVHQAAVSADDGDVTNDGDVIKNDTVEPRAVNDSDQLSDSRTAIHDITSVGPMTDCNT